MLLGKGGKKLIREISHRIKRDNITAVAAQLSYQMILGFFPFLIFLLTLTDLIPELSVNLLRALESILPAQAFDIVEGILNGAIHRSNGTLLSFSMIAAVWITSDGLAVLIKGINGAYGCDEKRKFLRRKFISIIFTLGLAVAIVLSILVIVFGQVLGRYLFDFFGDSAEFVKFWEIARYPTALLAIVLILSTMYYFLPCSHPRLGMVLPGAVFSALAWILVSGVISFYFSSFKYFSNTYGSIGGIIILLVWLYWTGIILLLGAEINASIGTIYKSYKS